MYGFPLEMPFVNLLKRNWRSIRDEYLKAVSSSMWCLWIIIKCTGHFGAFWPEWSIALSKQQYKPARMERVWIKPNGKEECDTLLSGSYNVWVDWADPGSSWSMARLANTRRSRVLTIGTRDPSCPALWTHESSADSSSRSCYSSWTINTGAWNWSWLSNWRVILTFFRLWMRHERGMKVKC